MTQNNFQDIVFNQSIDLNIDNIKKEINDGYISVKESHRHFIKILNYTNKCQYDWHWNNETMQCRGLILDNNWNIVSRPFKKFFSAEQLNYNIPSGSFDVYEKMDGSLGISYHVDGKSFIATRGSFDSEQAIKATEILNRKYGHIELNPELTYLFEIIYPENRIVVDYGNMEDLVLLAIVETKTGLEKPLENIGFHIVKKYDAIDDFDKLLKIQEKSKEGFVVKFQSGERVKVKFHEYKRLHKLLTGVSARRIWEILRSGDKLNEVVERVPDEFYNWVRDVENRLLCKFSYVEYRARQDMIFTGNRNEIAAHFNQCKYPHVMFSMLDKKDYTDVIWKIVKPDDTFFKVDKIA